MPSPKNYPRATVPLSGDELFIISQHNRITNTDVTVYVSLNDILGPVSPFMSRVKADAVLQIQTAADSVRAEFQTHIQESVNTALTETSTQIQSSTDRVRSDLVKQIDTVTAIVNGMDHSTANTMSQVSATLASIQRNLEGNTATLKADMSANTSALSAALANTSTTLAAAIANNATTMNAAIANNAATFNASLAGNVASLTASITKAVANVVTKDALAPATVFRYSANLSFGGLLVVGKQTKTFSVPGVKIGDAILLTPRNALPSAFMLGEAVCLSNDVLQVTLFSTTGATIGTSSVTFDVVCFR